MKNKKTVLDSIKFDKKSKAVLIDLGYMDKQGLIENKKEELICFLFELIKAHSIKLKVNQEAMSKFEANPK